MAELRTFVCVTCPVGCTLEAEIADGRAVRVTGNDCARGEAFVRDELTDPRRMLTTTVRVKGGALPLVPVRSSSAVPKGQLLGVAEALRSVTVAAPVESGHVVLEDALGTGVDILATRAVPSEGRTRTMS